MSAIPMPSADSLLKLLKDLLGKAPTVKRATTPSGTGPRSIAFYSRNNELPSLAWVCDLSVAASCSAALSLLPPAVVNESVKAGKLSEGLAENLHEFFNIGSTLFAVAANERIVLTQVVNPPDKPSADLAKLLAKPQSKAEFDVTISGYLTGRMTIVTG